ncbi:hypothetical protein ACFYNZ_16940 [Streptomyces kebangsaanensis]|uniref:Uncharacterized protein n=1 Tax=Streptomyces kebangsaanensis TaxID=864058 RepID=A0ABW6KW52_9ACTN
MDLAQAVGAAATGAVATTTVGTGVVFLMSALLVRAALSWYFMLRTRERA